MFESESRGNRKKMEETSGKVLARLHHMKSLLCKTIKSKDKGNSFSRSKYVDDLLSETPQFCTGMSSQNESYYSVDQEEVPTDTSLLDVSFLSLCANREVLKEVLSFE